MSWKKNKGVIIIFIFVAAVSLVYFFVVKRLVAEIEKGHNKLQELETIQESQRNRLGDLPNLRKDFEKIEEAEKKISPFLRKDKAVELIQEIEKLAEDTQNKVAIEVITPDPPAKKSTTTKKTQETIVSSLPIKDYIQLRIGVTGSFFSLLKFMNKLENSTYYLDILSLQMSRNDNPDESDLSEAATKNPFGQPSLDVNNESQEQVGDSQEIISLINVAIYTQD